MSFFIILTLVMIGIFFLPFGIACSYLLAGFVLLRHGKKEKNEQKIKSGKVTMTYAFTSLVLLFVIAFSIFYQILHWEL